ncbi:hypothetical protein N9954_02060 [Maribacter sp.]|nr:hypothetical protein [Maribacter sp.]
MNDIRRNLRMMFVVVLLFICNKFFVRPYILENEFPVVLDIFVLSFPNLCEAILGGLLLTNISLFAKYRFLKKPLSITGNHIYLFAVLITALYVLLQEFKIHNLGGNNVYDPYDVLFSVIGLLALYFILWYTKPVISFEQEPEK